MRFIIIVLFLGLAFPNFKFDQSKSNISYTGTHPFHEWTGTTSEVQMTTDCELMSLNCGATISVPVISFMSGNDNRDSNMLFHIDAFSYPVVKISFVNLNIPDLLSSTENINFDGEIDFHGYKVMQKIPLLATKSKNTFFIKSSFYIKLNLFDIDQPSLLMIPIKNEVKIDVIISGGFIGK